MKSVERFTPAVIRIIRETIQDAGGNEVLCVGHLNERRMVTEIEAVARGTDGSAPAVYSFMEQGDVVIHNHPSGELSPSAADVKVASLLGNQGIGFYIIDNQVLDIYCVSEAVEGLNEINLEGDVLSDHLKPGGMLNSHFPSYEFREVQVQMLEEVTRAFNEKGISVIEAGTGVGKSLAYLLPSASWTLRNKDRVEISTSTNYLPQQLLDKDIPLAEKILGESLNAKLVKGRGNYVCLRRLQDALEDMSLFRDNDNELSSIRSWVKMTKTGSRDDLSFFPSREIWGKVCSEADACMGLRCPFREDCFVLRARREAAASNLLVVNHHLLFSDLAARMDGAGFDTTAVLPPAHRIIFDEAHSLEQSATSFFSSKYNKLALFKQLYRLYTRNQKGVFGLSQALSKMSRKPEHFEKIPAAVQALHGEAERLDTQLLGFLGGRMSFRLKPGLKEEELGGIVDSLRKVRVELVKLLGIMEAGLAGIEEEYEQESEVFETGIIQMRLAKFAALLSSLEDYDGQEGFVCWIEKGTTSKKDNYCSLILTPLKIDTMMQEAVYEPHKTVVSTSATLTVRKNFEYWMGRVGLNGAYSERISTLRLDSPFEYRRRVLLAVPSDAPGPSEEGYQEFVIEFVQKCLEVSGGSGLVLFTSYKMLMATYESVAPPLEELGIAVLRQGSEDRSKLLEKFHSDISSVLFATNSFWEGVDAPGESLKLVIICRLPFGVPTDPVIQARMEAIELEGGNSFFNFSLPQAAMKLRQGFGRLMRKKTDRGVVAILDSRIIKKSYGKVLIDSLPNTIRKIEESPYLLQDIENFFFDLDTGPDE